MIEKIYDILKELKNESSLNKKIEILESNRSNEELKEFFYFTYTQNYKYNIKKIPECPKNLLLEVNNKSWNDVKEQLLRFANRTVTGNKAIKELSDFLYTSNEKVIYVMKCILHRNARCGVSIQLINKTWNELIQSEIKLCKAMPYSNKNVSYIKFPAYSQKKCDGARCLTFKSDIGVILGSSSGKEFTGLNSLESELMNLFNENIILDGELLIYRNNKPVSRKEGNGILNKSLHNTISPEEQDTVHFIVWDCITESDYIHGKSSIAYSEVMLKLKKEIEKNNLSHIELVESKEVCSLQEALDHFHSMLEKGEEGTILKNKDMNWEGKRVKDCVKMKLIIENTFQIVDFIEGNEKYQGTLGALVCKSSDDKVFVNVGSGLSDKNRKDIWNNKEKFQGTFVEIESNGIISTDSGSYSMFLPRFKNFRPDKTEADDFDTIKALSIGSSLLAV